MRTAHECVEASAPGDESIRLRTFGYLDEIMGTDPLGKRSLNLLCGELNVFGCRDRRFLQRKTVRLFGQQTFRNAPNTGFGKGHLLEEQEFGLVQFLL